jgi:hypothetical protein
MAELAKAKLIELDQQFTQEKDGGRRVEVQFNPESLKVTFANEIKQPEGGDQSAGTAGRQFVGAGTTKLAVQLWFDVTAMEEDPVDDVRRLTQQVVYFMTPQRSDAEPEKLAPPGVRFQWGTFLFDGMVEGLEESLEFFSPDGKPLRATISLTFSQQKILEVEFKGDGRVPTAPGQAPLKAAKQGESLQNMAQKNGRDDWQSIAAANAIEDPLRMNAGQLVNLNAAVGVSGGAAAGGTITGSFGVSAGAPAAGTATFGVSASGGVTATGVAGASAGGAGLNASLGGSLSGSLSLG